MRLRNAVKVTEACCSGKPHGSGSFWWWFTVARMRRRILEFCVNKGITIETVGTISALRLEKRGRKN